MEFIDRKQGQRSTFYPPRNNKKKIKKLADQSTSYSRSDKLVPPQKINTNTVLQRTDSASNKKLMKKIRKNNHLHNVATDKIAWGMLRHFQITGISRMDGIIKYLKKCIKVRIDEIFGDELLEWNQVVLREVVRKYRQKFRTEEDQAFLLDVLDRYSSEMDEDCNKTNTERTEQKQKNLEEDYYSEDLGSEEDFDISEDVGVELKVEVNKGDNKLQNKLKLEVEDVDVKIECFKEENNDAPDVCSVDDEDLEDY